MLKFEWDEAKNIANKKKHGVSFELAAHWFANGEPFIISSNRDEETRFKAIIDAEDDILTVVFTYRNDKIRIISARRASREERKIYS